MVCEQLTFNLDWRTRAKSSMFPNLPCLPKLSKATFKYALLGIDKTSRADLIRCEKCYLTVHKICYGINENIMFTSWICDRCQSDSLVSVSIFYKLYDNLLYSCIQL